MKRILGESRDAADEVACCQHAAEVLPGHIQCKPLLLLFGFCPCGALFLLYLLRPEEHVHNCEGAPHSLWWLAQLAHFVELRSRELTVKRTPRAVDAGLH